MAKWVTGGVSIQGEFVRKRTFIKEFTCLKRFYMKIVISNTKKNNYLLHGIILPELYIGDQAMYS